MSPEVTSTSNSRVKRLVRLRDRKHRDAEKVFVVEEPRIIERALTSGHLPLEIYFSPERWQHQIPDGVDALALGDDALAKASYRRHSTGVIAVFSYLETGLEKLAIGDNPLIIVAEGLEKPGNIGALLRIGDAAGVDGVVVVDAAADPFNPNVVRASTGALFTVPLGVAEEVADVTRWLTENDICSFAAVPEADETLWSTDLSGRTAIWIGAEADGLAPTTRNIVDQEIAIPMAGSMDSLNASVAAALITFEAVRQRDLP